jgi:hypothetical protein
LRLSESALNISRDVLPLSPAETMHIWQNAVGGLYHSQHE